MINEHDTVALIEDRPADNLRCGDVGAVVHLHAGQNAFEVEFIDERGKTKTIVAVPGSQLMRLNMMPQSA